MNVKGFFESARFCSLLVICPAMFAVVLTGCEKNSEIKVYRVSKAPLEESASQQQDALPTNTAAPRMPGGLSPPAETAIATPPNWEPQPLSQMRQASFLVKGDNGAVADISFVSLGTGAGSVLDNVNRWLDQLDQPPITEEKLGETAQRLRTSLGDIIVVDLAGLPKNAIRSTFPSLLSLAKAEAILTMSIAGGDKLACRHLMKTPSLRRSLQ